MLGVDGRQMHIDQSNLVFDAKGVDPSRYRFELADIFQLDLSDEPPFDVVLCLGLLYHVSKPFELFERISAWNADLLVVDTAISSIGGPFFRIVGQDLDEPRSAVDRAVALHPSGEAVTRLAEEFGYTSAVMLRPRFTSWEGAASYKSGRRRAFICSKHTALEGLDTEPVRVRGEKRKRSAARHRIGAIGRPRGRRRDRRASRLWPAGRTSGSGARHGARCARCALAWRSAPTGAAPDGPRPRGDGSRPRAVAAAPCRGSRPRVTARGCAPSPCVTARGRAAAVRAPAGAARPIRSAATGSPTPPRPGAAAPASPRAAASGPGPVQS